MPRVPGSQKLVERNLSSPISECLDAFDRPVDLRLPPMRLGHDARDGAAVARNHHGLPALYIIEELGQMRFSLGCLDFAHGGIPLVRMVDLTGRTCADENEQSTAHFVLIIGSGGRAWHGATGGIRATARSVQRHSRKPEQRIRRLFKRPDHRADAPALDQPAAGTRLPRATGTAQDMSEISRAAYCDHAAELTELGRADTRGQGAGGTHG